MQKWIGIVVVSVAVVLGGCGKENKSKGGPSSPVSNSNETSNGPTNGTTDQGKTTVAPGPLSEFVGTYSKKKSSKEYEFDVTVEMRISLTASQLIVQKTCIRGAASHYSEGRQVAEASAQIEVTDRNHFKLAAGIAQDLTLVIPEGSPYVSSKPDVECNFEFPAGTYVLDFVGDELVIGGPGGRILRMPKSR